MKKNIPTILLALSLTTLYAFDVGQEIEMEAFVNARTNANFLKTTKNIKTTLAKGTTGSVLEVKNFSSGNAGIKMKVTSGPRTGESYWVYFNKKEPAIKVVDTKGTKDKKEPKEVAPEVVTPEIIKEDRIKAEIKKDTPSIRVPEEQAVIDTVSESITIKEQVTEILVPPSSKDCPPVIDTTTTTLSGTSEKDYHESKSIAPFREVPRASQSTPKFVKRNDPSYSVFQRDGEISSFSLSNNGPNSIVPTNEYYIARKFDFEFDDRARSEIKMLVTDSPDDISSRATTSIMVFFPRSVLPSIERVGNELHVTLPTKEVIKYNATTKEIIGGVLTEGKMSQSPGSPAKPAALKYTGEGVMIRADRSGSNLPYGDMEVNGRATPNNVIATVSKKGEKDCKIPSKDIWYTDKNYSSPMIKPELQSDAGLDSFLKKRCGFSL